MLALSLRRRFLAAFALFSVGALAPACSDDTSDTSSSTTSTGSTTSSSGTGGSGGGGGGGEPGVPIKILNWNIRNFFDDQDNSEAAGEEVRTQAQFEAQVAAAAAILSELDPDVAMLQEIENENVLNALNAAVGNRYPHRVSLLGNDPRGVNLAAMSKLPFDEVTSHKDDQFTLQGTQGPVYTFARDCGVFEITHAGREIALLNVHFRSKGPPDDPNKRLAEAQFTRNVANSLTQANPEKGVIVLGDFNDLPGSDPYNVILGPESNRYIDVVDVIPVAERWTFEYLGAKELIDHQMANPLMYGFVDPASVMIRKGSDVGLASDHFPIMATYYVR